MTLGSRHGRAILGLAVATAAACSASSTAIAGDGSFPDALSSTAAAGDGPEAIAVGDFNNDGKEDLVVANFFDESLTVRLGDGAGGLPTEPPGSPFGTDFGPVDVAVADLNGDGNEDLVVVDTNFDNFIVRLGNGAGGFAVQSPGSPFTTLDSPRGVAITDFNNDNVADLAIVQSSSNTVTIRLGNGAGGFSTEATGSPFATGLVPESVAFGDFNNDGNADLAIANIGDDITVRLGSGTGSFATQATGSPFGAGGDPEEVVVGDFNNDGNEDLATANSASDDVTVRLGNGAGGFAAEAPGSPLAAGDRPESLAVGDLDRDGNQDLAVAGFDSKNIVLRRGGGAPADAGNLLANGGGEAPAGQSAPSLFSLVAPIPGWTTTGVFTNHRYSIGAAPYPDRLIATRIGGQEAFFTIGTSEANTTASQTVDVSSSALSIDAGLATATLRGYLGGFRAANDTMEATASFNDATGTTLGAPIRIGPVTTADRKNQTVLLRSEGSAAVPAGTRSITVTLLGTRGTSPHHDAAYADRMALFLDAPPDSVAPQTKITKGPRNKTPKKKAKYKFTSTEAGSTFECKLDSKKFKRCSSPRKLKRLDLGRHKFSVRAIDPSGNVDRSPAKDRFKRKGR